MWSIIGKVPSLCTFMEPLVGMRYLPQGGKETAPSYLQWVDLYNEELTRNHAKSLFSSMKTEVSGRFSLRFWDLAASAALSQETFTWTFLFRSRSSMLRDVWLNGSLPRMLAAAAMYNWWFQLSRNRVPFSAHVKTCQAPVCMCIYIICIYMFPNVFRQNVRPE